MSVSQPMNAPFISSISATEDRERGLVVEEFSLPFRGAQLEGRVPLTFLPGSNRQLFDLCIGLVDPLRELGLTDLVVRLHAQDHQHYGWVSGGSELYGDLDLVERSLAEDGVLSVEVEESLNAVSVLTELSLQQEEREFLVSHNFTSDDRLWEALQAFEAMRRDLAPDLRPEWLDDDFTREFREKVTGWYKGSGHARWQAFSDRGDRLRYHWFVDDICLPNGANETSLVPSIVFGFTFVGHGWKAGVHGQPGQALFVFHSQPLIQTVVRRRHVLRLPGTLYPTFRAVNSLFWEKSWEYIRRTYGD